jgi:ATP-dependent protease ClpP protease subunit
VFLALLPAAVAGGMALANHRASDDQKLIDALRAQRPPVVTVAGGQAATSAGASRAATRHRTRSAKSKASAKVLTHSKAGTAHAVTGFKPSASKIASDRVAVQKVTKEVGKNYLRAQKNLPDTVVVTGSPGAGSTPAPQGRGD